MRWVCLCEGCVLCEDVFCVKGCILCEGCVLCEGVHFV